MPAYHYVPVCRCTYRHTTRLGVSRLHAHRKRISSSLLYCSEPQNRANLPRPGGRGADQTLSSYSYQTLQNDGRAHWRHNDTTTCAATFKQTLHARLMWSPYYYPATVANIRQICRTDLNQISPLPAAKRCTAGLLL